MYQVVGRLTGTHGFFHCKARALFYIQQWGAAHGFDHLVIQKTVVKSRARKEQWQ